VLAKLGIVAVIALANVGAFVVGRWLVARRGRRARR
jgi:hypothetical protein